MCQVGWSCNITSSVGLAVTLSELESEKHIVANDPEKLKVLFHEMTQMCLWCAHSSVDSAERAESIIQGEMLQSVPLFSDAYHTDSFVGQDLSLLTNMTPEDIEHLQTIGRDAQHARKEFILKDDQSAAWEHITTLKDARIDFVLDNGEILAFPAVSSN